jgi:polyisoprenoid-binding protein YceI
LIRTGAIVAALPALIAGALRAQAVTVTAAPLDTKVEFSLGATLHTVHGTFSLKRCELRFNPAAGEVSGEIVIDATSGASGNGARDRRMHKDVLESARYPEIVFRPDRIEGKLAAAGSSHLTLYGMLSMHGAERELAIPLDMKPEGERYAVTAKFPVNYKGWGMKNPSSLFLRVSDTVEITVRTTVRMIPAGSQ